MALTEVNMDETFYTSEEYIVIKAIDSPVQIIGLTRGDSTKPHHTENLDKNEVCVMQFTQRTSAIKIRGKAEIYTKHGVIRSGE